MSLKIPPKRVNFIGVQNAHSIACNGYTQLPVRTGYESVVAHRTTDLFAVTAKKPGKVISMSKEGIVVLYDDGEQKGYELGRRFGKAAGLVIPHTIVTEMKPDHVFKEGECICYNSGFFEKDILNSNNVILKSGLVVRTALMESPMTLEDSSSIAERVSNLLVTKTTKEKNITLSFDENVHRLVKVGTSVESEDILCIIEDAVTSVSGLFDEDTLDTLRVLSMRNPRAKMKGVVENIEVFYNGDIEDMSDTLRAIVNESDRALNRKSRATNKGSLSGNVDESYRVDGEPLAVDTIVIKIYITGDVATGIGDKIVFCNQMKSVIGKIIPDTIESESGKHIDAIFSYQSIENRIVTSPILMGTTATLLDLIGKNAVAAYRS